VALPEAASLLLLLGKQQEAKKRYANYRTPFALSQEWKDFNEAVGQFGRGEMSEEAYLAKAGNSRWRQCYALSAIGMNRLAAGDRAGAKAHFVKVVNSRAVLFFEWNWGVMILSRLEEDPNWPPWILGKK
jgi:hypothetical protein